MRAKASFITAHRLARLNAWARLWLVWASGVFADWWRRGDRDTPRALDHAARMVGQLIILHATARYAPPPRRSRQAYGRLIQPNLRTLLGASIRRALRGKDAPSRLFTILAVMRDLERYVARLLKRLRCVLTRLCARIPAPQAPARLMPACAPPRAACADTS